MTAPPNGPYPPRQPGPYGPPPGGFHPGPPPRRNTGLVVALVAVGVLALGVLAFFLFAEKPSPPTPPPPVPGGSATAGASAAPQTTPPPLSDAQVAEARGHAEEYVAALNARDEAAAKALTCGGNDAAFKVFFDNAVEHAPVELVAEPRIVDESRAVFDIELEPGRTIPFEVVGPDTWCVYS